MQDMFMGTMVRALELVLKSSALTAADKQCVSGLLDAEVAALIAEGGHDASAMAQRAVKEAVKKRRRSQGVATRTAAKREEARRQSRSALGR